MKRLVVATLNPGKLAEFAEALRGMFEVVDLASLGGVSEVEETGATFEANARLKAEAYSTLTDLPLVADDSGIEVDALGGAPGVQSARWGGPALDDPGRNRALLDALRDVPPAARSARFRCVLAVALAGRTLAVFDGVVEGFVAEAPRGGGGFGYDPVFFHPPTGGTFAELTRAEKQRFSHRGQAIASLLRALREGDSRLAPLDVRPVDAPRGGW
jgi:XTP/dITP diphosphohydrolase